MTIIMRGTCPAKKNLWKRGKSGRMYLNDDVRAQIDTLTVQAESQWGREPLEHPDMEVRFYVATKRRDRDGMFTTVLDCLQAAGVLRNDNLAHNNGKTVLHPAQFVREGKERVEVEIHA